MTTHDGETYTQPPHHAFDDPEFLDYIESSFPQQREAVDQALRPTFSDQPDELETWEGNAILERKQQFKYESQPMYLRRLLYEETFSVNQKPDDTELFRGVAGMTPGGLLSHFYPDYGINSFRVETVAAMPEVLSEPTFAEAAVRAYERDERQASGLIDMVGQCLPEQYQGASSLFLLKRLVDGGSLPELYDTLGFRLYKMLASAPEMMEPVEDKELQATFVPSDISRAELIVMAWRRSQILLPNGYFTSQDSPEINEAIGNLLTLRTHPEMQSFFRFLSPSGYINQPTASPAEN